MRVRTNPDHHEKEEDMKKRIGSLFLVLALCLSLLPMTVLAEDTVAMPAYSGGNGTESDPWLISSVADLQLLANTINGGNAAGFDADCTDTGDGIPGNYHGYYFKQTTDLDLSSIESWDPIGYSGSFYFAGNYDGGGHIISNAKSTGKNDKDGFATAGIFGWVAFGSVKNLTVKKADFFAEGNKNMSYAGGVLAVAYSCTVENCSVYNSKIESRRAPNENSNYAGGITGIALDSSFEKCASVKNTIRHGSFGGGFIGSLDNGDSNFTNCYVANCIVTGCSDTASNSTLSGGFLGASMDGDAILNSCFVYDCVAQPDTTSKGEDYFAIFTPNTQYGKIVVTSHVYYYDANGAKVNAEELKGAESKTVDDFTDGTVAKALGEAFAQGKLYPVFVTDPADYTAVDAAIAKANALTKSDYTDFTAVDNAVNAVVRDKKIAEQSAVDDMAKAIEDAIKALVKKPTSGDYYEPTYPVTTPDKTENGSVTVSPKNATSGSTVTVTVTPDSGYTLETLTVTDKNGKELKLTDKGDGKYTFTMPSGKVDIKATFMEDNSLLNFFYDVPNDSYYFDAVKWAVKNGITAGVGDNLFAPNQPCTRAEIVTFLWRAAGSPVVNYAMNMSDIPEGAYYAEAVRWALSEGIAVGTSADTFSPDDTCTRAEAVTFLCRAKGSKMDYNNEFTDVGGDDYYADAVAWAEKNNVTVGVGNDKFAPDDDCSRGQIVTFLYRTYQN